MKCPNCNTIIPEQAKFCNQCGHKLEIACPACGMKNPGGSKFCIECGHKLVTDEAPASLEPSFEEKLNKIQRYLPQGLTEKILSQKEKIEGERKQVTVMFCDMVGFTELSEKIGPEDAYSVMDQVYEILIHKVHEFEGTVNEMTGDGVLALFGAPISMEDAPQRAIRVAMAIHREMTKFNEILKQEKTGLPALKMRAGIHTGPVVVGTLGNDLRVEFKAVGNTVNLASRMETIAEPGTTYVTADTFKLTEGLFRFEALGEKLIKGKKEPVPVYRVIATSTRRTRFDVSAERGLTPFVGRERELEILLDGFERARAGRGQSFSITAEAGVGKSRLLYEFRKAVSNEDITLLEGKCLSYSRSVSYHPVIDILKSNFNILEHEDCHQIRKKVSEGLKAIGADEASTLPYLLELMSVKESGIDQIDMSPEARKDRMMAAVRLITIKGAEIRPLVIAVEDLHWIDKSSEECFKLLLESISGARIFLIFTYRPEYVHAWGGKSYHSQINLNRLSNRESLSMVAHLLGTSSVDREIEELVLEKTEGVPFFIEEFIKTLKELKIIEASQRQYHLVKDARQLTIPSTIQEVIMSRVDALPEGAKEILQVGAAIDREFTYALLQKVVYLPERELLSRLSVLKDMELIYERGVYPECSYVFKHALTQEVVYDSILVKRKRTIHEKIGKAIEEIYELNIDEFYEILSDHFMKAENYEKIDKYFKLSGRKAINKASIEDAIMYGKKRLASLESRSQTEEIQKKIIEVRTQIAFLMTQIHYYLEAKKSIDPVIDKALKYNSKKQLARIYIIEGSYLFFIEEDLTRAFYKLEEACKVSEEIGDISSLFVSLTQLGTAKALNCEFEYALECLQKATQIMQKVGSSKWGLSINKSYHGFFVYNFQGKVDLAYQTTQEAVQLADESGDILSKAQAYICHGRSCYQKGYLADAEKYVLEGLNYTKPINLFAWEVMAKTILGEIYFEFGNYEESKKNYMQNSDILEKHRYYDSWQCLNKTAAARAAVLNNERDIDPDVIREFISAIKIKGYEGWIRRYFADILLNMNGEYLHDAEGWILEAIEADQRNGKKFHLGQDYALYADFYKRTNDPQKTDEYLNQAIQIFKECGADGWVEKYEKQVREV